MKLDDVQLRYKSLIDSLRCENAYLKGKIHVYEKFLYDHGYIKELEDCGE